MSKGVKNILRNWAVIIMIFGIAPLYFIYKGYNSTSYLLFLTLFFIIVGSIVYKCNVRIREFFNPIKMNLSIFLFLLFVPTGFYLCLYFIDYTIIKGQTPSLSDINMKEVLTAYSIIAGYALTIIIAMMTYYRMKAGNMEELFFLLKEFFKHHSKSSGSKIYFIAPTPFLGYLIYKKTYYRIFKDHIVDNDNIEIVCLPCAKENIEKLKTFLEDIKNTFEEENNKREQDANKNEYLEPNLFIRFIHRLFPQKKIIDSKGMAYKSLCSKRSDSNNEGWKRDKLICFHLDELENENENSHVKYDYLIEFCNTMINLFDKNKIKKNTILDYDNGSRNTYPFIALTEDTKSPVLWATVEVISQSKTNSTGELYLQQKISMYANSIFNGFIGDESIDS